MLRRATEEDLPRLVELWMEMMNDHHDFEPRMELSKVADSAYQSYLLLHTRSAKSLIVLDEQDEGIVGFCCAYICQNLPMFEPSEFGYISDLAVTAAWQAKGIGTSLLKYTEEWFKKYNMNSLHLQVYSKNRKGKRFWEGKGFEPFVERLWLDL
jgi:GNAT superfamily N-acetyltransferase